MNSIILIGFKSCGKSTVGWALSQRLQLPFIDTDALMVQQHFADTGIYLSNADIYRFRGQEYFRDLEKRVISGLQVKQPHVIATGGGSLCDPNNRHHLKRLGCLVYLSLSAETLIQRIQAGPASAVVENEPPVPKWMLILTERLPLYQQFADAVIVADHQSVDAIVNEIVNVVNLDKVS